MRFNFKNHLLIVLLTILCSTIVFSKTSELRAQANLMSGIDAFSISAYVPMDCGAVGVKIYTTSTKFAGVTSKIPDYMSRVIDTCAAFAWYAADGITPIHFDANEPIVTVTLAEKTGDSCFITIVYTMVNINGNEYNTSLSISNSIPAPCIVVDPPISASFDTTRIDSTKQLIFTITNPSPVALHIDSLYTDIKYFAVAKKLESGQINKGDTAKFTVSFTPNSMKNYYGQLFIANNSSTQPYRVLLGGVGIDSLTELRNKSWKSTQGNLISGIDTFSVFASSPLDCSEISMQIYNVTWPLSIISKLNPSYSYSYEDKCVTIYFPTWSLHFDAYEPIVTVALAKKTVDNSNVTIKYLLADNSGTFLNTNLLVSYNLSGSLIEVHPSSISFGPVKKDIAQLLSFSITNPSIIALQIDSLWTNTKYFDVTNISTSRQIRAGDTIKATIFFAPDSDKTYIDTLFIANNYSILPYKVPLSGYGTDSLTTPHTSSLMSIQNNFISGINTFSISAHSSLDYGAVCMRINVKLAKIIDVNSKLPGFISRIIKDTSVVIAWNSKDGITPVHFDADEPIVTVTLEEKTGNGSSIAIDYELTDIHFNVINIDISVSNILSTSVSVNIPSKFELKQNFPNPFNPTTTISFSIPSKLHVTLKVFDLLGKEISCLASEELSTGTYERQWYANTLPSGVYFCRVQAGSFSDTKKLILLR